jgi:hypothetical protein
VTYNNKKYGRRIFGLFEVLAGGGDGYIIVAGGVGECDYSLQTMND